jgi:predicted DCC family thiol-disulfide oxidoreductase YuxK
VTSSPIILFDGSCNFCNASVLWIIRHDPNARFQFAPRQSEAARAVLAQRHIDPATLPESMILLEPHRILARTDAIITIARTLGLPWSLARLALIIPRPIRDAAYALIARNRHRLARKPAACAVPTPELQARFLDARPINTTPSSSSIPSEPRAFARVQPPPNPT